MLTSLVKGLMGIVSLGFLIFSGVLLYNGLGLWGFLLVLLVAAGVVFLLIFVIGTPEPEGGWWIVRVELETVKPVDDEACFQVVVDKRQNRPLIELALSQKAAFLLEQQLHQVGGDCAYELRLSAGVASREAWADRQHNAKKAKPKEGYVHYLIMEAWRDGGMHWGATASLERSGIELEPQIDALLAAAFDCFGRSEVQAVEEIGTREHGYVGLLKEEFGAV